MGCISGGCYDPRGQSGSNKWDGHVFPSGLCLPAVLVWQETRIQWEIQRQHYTLTRVPWQDMAAWHLFSRWDTHTHCFVGIIVVVASTWSLFGLWLSLKCLLSSCSYKECTIYCPIFVFVTKLKVLKDRKSLWGNLNWVSQWELLLFLQSPCQPTNTRWWCRTFYCVSRRTGASSTHAESLWYPNVPWICSTSHSTTKSAHSTLR